MLNRVDFKGCCEKSELLERVQRLWDDLQNCPGIISHITHFPIDNFLIRLRGLSLQPSINWPRLICVKFAWTQPLNAFCWNAVTWQRARIAVKCLANARFVDSILYGWCDSSRRKPSLLCPSLNQSLSFCAHGTICFLLVYFDFIKLANKHPLHAIVLTNTEHRQNF